MAILCIREEEGGRGATLSDVDYAKDLAREYGAEFSYASRPNPSQGFLDHVEGVVLIGPYKGNYPLESYWALIDSASVAGIKVVAITPGGKKMPGSNKGIERVVDREMHTPENIAEILHATFGQG